MNDLPISTPLVPGQSEAKVSETPTHKSLIQRLKLNRFLADYGWAILPFIIITIFLANTHYNYATTWLGTDEPDHFDNILAIVQTGQMPPPPTADHPCDQTRSCEAFQPPLFYQLMAIPTRIAMALTNLKSFDAGTIAAKLVLFLLSIGWFLLILYAIQLIMPRRAWLAKMLVACAAMLIAQVVMIDTMVTNDFAETIVSLAALIVLYLIVRTERKQKLLWWLLAAALTGLCVAFKYSGVQFALVYAAVAGCIALGYLIKLHPVKVGQVLICAAAGSPLIVIPYLSTTQHELLYLGPNGFQSVPFDEGWKGDYGAFLGTFDTAIFSQPMWGLMKNAPVDEQAPGLSSFWSLQYIGLFVDSNDRWFSSREFGLPPDQLEVNQMDGSTLFLAHPLSVVRYNQIIQVTRLAIPIGLLMMIGLLCTGFRFVVHPRRVMRDGTLVILLAAGAVFGSFMEEVIRYHNRAWFTQPRYALATYVLLLIVGTTWILKLWPKHRGLMLPIMKAALWVSIVAFCVGSYQLFWLTIG